MKKIRKKDLIINSIIIIILIVVLIIVILLKDNETKNNGEKTKETVFSPDKTVSSSKETIMYNLTINNINIFTFYPGTKSIYNISFDKDITDYKDTIEFKIMYQE